MIKGQINNYTALKNIKVFELNRDHFAFKIVDMSVGAFVEGWHKNQHCFTSMMETVNNPKPLLPKEFPPADSAPKTV
ncbi:hypothetical protein HanRHA438_Chr07g0292601 [Helianthus annuus]|nr:hypothetical protein HanRHA438_Chr07g0292601 [Helianthus annuus]